MLFSEVVKALGVVESTTQRTAMVKALVSLFKKADRGEVDKLVYFILGDLKPPWEGVELGVAEKLCIRALAKSTGASLAELESLYKRTGDVGEVAKRALLNRGRTSSLVPPKPLEMWEVYDTLLKVAYATGEGAVDMKLALLVSLFNRATPDEARYIARFVVGKLRLGVADMTLIEALSEAFGVDKEALERAYHIYPDMGKLARHVAEGRPLVEIKITPGVPILPMLAQRLSS
ncbi:MAG: DNA ligase, partial [Pyrobaculum sp.]